MSETKSANMVWTRDEVDQGLSVTDPLLPRILSAIKSLIEEYHPNLSRSLQYYDLIAGNWCLSFLHAVYVNYSEVMTRPRHFDGEPISVATDCSAFIQSAAWDASFNEGMQDFIQKTLTAGKIDGWILGETNYRIRNAASGTKSWSKKAFRLLTNSRPDVLITFPYVKCPPKEWVNAIFKWRTWATWDDLPYPINVSGQVDVQWRLKRAQDKTPVKTLEDLVIALLPIYIPVIYLEAKEAFRNEVLSWNLKRPKIAYSANALHGHDAFKTLVGEWREEGTRLHYHQHGGCYGIDKSHVYERYEVAQSDKFYTFGWTDERSNVVPLSPPSLNGYQAPKKKWSAMLVGLGVTRHVFRLEYGPKPSTVQVIKQDIINFLAGCPYKENLLIRPYPNESIWGITDEMKRSAPQATFDTKRKRPFESYLESKIVIHSYLSTGWLETMAMDVPTLGFYDPKAYAFRASAQPWIDALEGVGVLHRSGIAAAKFVSGLGGNPEAWWMSQEVRSIVKGFVDKYANFSPDWKSQWEQEFKSALDTF